MKHIKTLSTLGLALLLSHCELNNSQETNEGSATNSPALTKSMGEEIEENLSQSQTLEEALNISSLEEEFTLATQVEEMPETPTTTNSLAKTGNPEVQVNIDYSKISQGYIIITSEVVSSLFTKIDSAWVVWDALAKDTILNNENIMKVHGGTYWVSGRKDFYQLDDYDGDKILSGELKYQKSGRFKSQSINTLGTVLNTEAIIESGPDKLFDTEEDNKVVTMYSERFLNSVKIGSTELIDQDLDGYIIDPAKKSSTVLLKTFKDNGYKQANLEMIVELVGKDSIGQIISLSGTEKYLNGRETTLSLKNQNGSTTILPGDIATLRVKTSKTVGVDSIRGTEIQVVFIAPNGLEDSASHQILEVHVKKEFAYGRKESLEFDFVSSQPIPSGQEPKSGTVKIKLSYKAGGTAEYIGTFSNGNIQGTLVDIEGNTYTVEYDSNGNVKSSSN